MCNAIISFLLYLVNEKIEENHNILCPIRIRTINIEVSDKPVNVILCAISPALFLSSPSPNKPQRNIKREIQYLTDKYRYRGMQEQITQHDNTKDNTNTHKIIRVCAHILSKEHDYRKYQQNNTKQLLHSYAPGTKVVLMVHKRYCFIVPHFCELSTPKRKIANQYRVTSLYGTNGTAKLL